VDFLEHEVAEVALVGGFGTFVVLHGFALTCCRPGPRSDLITADFGDIAFFQVHEAVGDLAQGQLVGRQEVLARPRPITSGLPLRRPPSGWLALITARP
jgi:hypothetical protein